MKIKFVILVSVSFIEAAKMGTGIISRAMQTVGKCNKQHPLEMKEMERAITYHELPTSEEGKCFLSCFLDEFGLVSDGQINLETSHQIHMMTLKDPEELKKADDLTAACKEELSSSTAEGCDFALTAASCILQKSKDMGVNFFQFTK